MEKQSKLLQHTEVEYSMMKYDYPIEREIQDRNNHYDKKIKWKHE